MSEFTADRAGLLGCQDAEVAWKTLAKLAGVPQKYFATLNTEDFLRQARDFQALDADSLSKIAKWISSVGETYPWTVVRAQQLLLWIDSGAYEEALKFPQRIPYHLPAGVKSYCPKCGYTLRGPEIFCPGCGSARNPVATTASPATS